MKKGKKGLALAMTLAVTMTSVPTAFALDGNAQPTKQPDNQLGQRDTKAISYKYTKLDQAPMKESVQASSENTPMQWSEGRQIWHLMGMLIQDGIPIITHIKVRIR